MKELSRRCEICKIFSSPVRLGILQALRGGEKNVSEIERASGASQSVVSQHLSMMKSRGILDIEKKGAFAYYRIKYPEIMDALDTMKSVTQKIKRGRI